MHEEEKNQPTFVIVKYIKNHAGVELPVILVDKLGSEIMEFHDEQEAERVKNMFMVNSDSGYRYECKQLGDINE